MRGAIKCVPVGADNLLFFDFSPFENPLPNGYRVCLHVYTLTGIVTNPATWKMTLKGTDGIMLMVNPADGHRTESSKSVLQLRDFLSVYGVGLHETPAILQLNSFTEASQPDEDEGIAATLGLSQLVTCRSNSASGEGLLEALTILSGKVLERVQNREQQNNPAHSVDKADLAIHSLIQDPTPLTSQATQVCADEIPAEPAFIDRPLVTLMSENLHVEGTTLKIPLEIQCGNTLNRFVVTVSVSPE